MKKLFALVCCLLLLAACKGEYQESSQTTSMLKKDPAAAGAVLAVREYNRRLIEAYRRNDVTPMKELVAEREYAKLNHLVEGLLANNLVMEAQLKEMSVEKVERWGEDNVVVSTEEKWRYRRVNKETGAEAKPLTDVVYRMVYKMVFRDGQWQLFNLGPAQ